MKTISKAFLACMLAASATAAVVEINLRNFAGASTTQPVTITNITGVVFNGTNTHAVPSKPYTPTNGFVSATLHAGSFRALIGPYSISFVVPTNDATYNISELATSGTAIGTMQLGQWILRNSGTGTNVSLFGTNEIEAITLGGVTRSTWPSGGGGATYTNNSTGLPGVIDAGNESIGTNWTSLLTAWRADDTTTSNALLAAIGAKASTNAPTIHRGIFYNPTNMNIPLFWDATYSVYRTFTFDEGRISYPTGFYGAHSGDGSGLTGLNADAITAGTLPSGRYGALTIIPTNAPLNVYGTAPTFRIGTNDFAGSGGSGETNAVVAGYGITVTTNAPNYTVAVDTNVMATLAEVAIRGAAVSNALSFSNSLVVFVDPNGDDTTARVGHSEFPFKTLNAAATAHSANSTILLSAGAYLVSNTVVLKEGVTLQGSGAVVSNYCLNAVPCIRFTNNCTIRNIRIVDAPSTTNFTYLLYASGGTTGAAALTNVLIEGCYFDGFSDGVVVQAGVLVKTNPVQIVVRNNVFRGEWDNLVMSSEGVFNVDIYGNVFSANRRNPSTYPLESSQLAHNIEFRSPNTNSSIRIWGNSFHVRATNAVNLWLDGKEVNFYLWGNYFTNELNSTNILLGHTLVGGYSAKANIGVNEFSGIAVSQNNSTISRTAYNVGDLNASGTITGNGAGLTNLPAAQLTGPVPAASLTVADTFTATNLNVVSNLNLNVLNAGSMYVTNQQYGFASSPVVMNATSNLVALNEYMTNLPAGQFGYDGTNCWRGTNDLVGVGGGASDPLTNNAIVVTNLTIVGVGKKLWAFKSSDTATNSNATMAADPELQLSLTPGVWAVNSFVRFTNGLAAMAAKMRIDYSGTTTYQTGFIRKQPYNTNPYGYVTPSAAGVDVIQSAGGQTTDGLVGSVEVQSVISVSTSGTMAVQWAQSVSSTTNTAAMKGSWISAERIQ